MDEPKKKFPRGRMNFKRTETGKGLEGGANDAPQYDNRIGPEVNQNMRELFLQHLEQVYGNATEACKRANMSYRGYRFAYVNDPEFKAEVDAIRNEKVVDYVEDKLMHQINNLDTTAIIFFLKTRGRHRGYDQSQPTQLEVQTKEGIIFRINGQDIPIS
jgi:hypothetical protein